MSRRFEVVALPTTATFEAGSDLVAALAEACADAGVELRDGDVVCVASKVVSKVEDRRVALPDAADVHAARRALALDEAVRVVADTPWVLVIETRHGFVCANAGIDTSNVGGDTALLLPEDPDGSAARIRAGIAAHAGVDVGVVVTDTFGRPWRLGQTDVAIGAAGVTVLRDDRGRPDLLGTPLEVTQVAIADELAAAADLARGKADGAPFVLLRGLAVAGDGAATDLVRAAAEDTFRWGGPTAVERAVLDRPRADDGAGVVADAAVVASALTAAEAALIDGAWSLEPVKDDRGRVRIRVLAGTTPDDAAAAGAAAQAAAIVLGGHGVATRWSQGEVGEGDGELRCLGVIVTG